MELANDLSSTALPPQRLELVLVKGSSRFKIVPAPKRRQWMERCFVKQPYKCLPLTTANQYGWAVQNPQTFSLEWDGGNLEESITIRGDADYVGSQFGHGILTFRLDFIFRTNPGYNLWLRGLPNFFIDGVHPLEGIVETDWLPYGTSVSWKVTRPKHEITIEKGVPICLITPVKRGEIESFVPSISRIDEDPQFAKKVRDFSDSRAAFIGALDRGELAPGEWQKHYVKGVLPDGSRAAPSSRTTKVMLREFPGMPAGEEEG